MLSEGINIFKADFADDKYPFEFEEYLDDIRDYPEVLEFSAPVCVKGALTKADDVYSMKADGEATVAIACCRCLAPVDVKLNFILDEKFNCTGSMKEETEFLEGGILDFKPYIKRAIINSLPMKVVCNEDCKGLCHMCGKNLNEGGCSCDTSYINPKFESLRSLFKLEEEV